MLYARSTLDLAANNDLVIAIQTCPVGVDLDRPWGGSRVPQSIEKYDILYIVGVRFFFCNARKHSHFLNIVFFHFPYFYLLLTK